VGVGIIGASPPSPLRLNGNLHGGAKIRPPGPRAIVRRPSHRILIVEDDRVTRTFLADNLVADGHEPLLADCARDALRLARTHGPEAVLLDLGLPDRDGLRLLEELRSGEAGGRIDPDLPVVVLTGRADELDRIRGLERGADDYVVKPFSYPELRLRLLAVLRRAGLRPARGRLRVGPLQIDPAARDVTLGAERLTLSQKEYGLLVLLASQPTRVFTKDEILREVWGFRARSATRTLDSHACRLRAKLAHPDVRFVLNVWGVGYRLVDVAETAA
jgi:DNA-binding response OmpR family regulator